MTVELTPSDALELRLLLDVLSREPLGRVYQLVSCYGGGRIGHYERLLSSDRERELRGGVEALERLLNGIQK